MFRAEDCTTVTGAAYLLALPAETKQSESVGQEHANQGDFCGRFTSSAALLMRNNLDLRSRNLLFADVFNFPFEPFRATFFDGG